MDYKGPIGVGRNQVYLHTQIGAYSWYPVVHILKSTTLTELKFGNGEARPKRPPQNTHRQRGW